MTPSQSFCIIPLTKGQVAVVDQCDFEKLSAHKWTAAWNKGTQSYYAQRTIRLPDGRRTTLPMHREILGLAHGDERTGDHWNHDTLDNRRSNLRIADESEQRFNYRRTSRNRSGFKGVSFRKDRNHYRVSIMVRGKHKYLGSRKTPREAHELYKAAALRMHGEFARLE